MTAKILTFVPPHVILSAVCVNCEATWTAILSKASYERYVRKNSRVICPCCGHTETGLAPQEKK